MFRKLCKAALSVTMIAWGVDCLAASTVDVNVTARLTPGACTPTFSNGGLIDVGVHKFTPGVQVGPIALDHPINLTIICNAPTTIAISLTDMRKSSLNPNSMHAYGIGFHDDGRLIGYVTYTITNQNLMYDGIPARSVLRPLSDITWTSTPRYFMFPRSQYAFADYGNIPKPYTTYNVTIVASVGFTGHRYGITSSTKLDGLAVLEITYL